MAAGNPKRVVIIGGGVIGLCTAYYALRRGHRVTVLERGAPDHDGCSLGNAGMIVPSHFVPLAAPGMVGLGLRMLLRPGGPFAIRVRPDPDLLRWCWLFRRAANAGHVARSAPLLRDLHLASRHLFEEMAEEGGNDFGLQKRGLLMLCKSARAFREEAHLAETARSLGLAADVLTAEAAARLDPGLRMEIAGAVFFPQDCHLSPPHFLAGLTRTLEREGATLRWCTEATGWRTAGDGGIEAVRTDHGDVPGDEFVLAGGAWSAALLRPLGVRLPLEAGKGYSFTLSHPKRLPALCSILTEARVAVTPMGAALRFAGTLEIGGRDRSIHRARVRNLLRAIPGYFPEFTADDFAGLPVWSGLRPCSPDGLPYVGRFARFENLCVATGHAMLGVSLGPVTGRLVAEIVSGDTPSFDIAALRPDRYAG